MPPVPRLMFLLLLFLCLAVACAAKQRPVVYPNEHLRTVGQVAARADIDDCLRLADEYHVVPKTSGAALKETTTDTATSVATGAATGALRGGGVGAAAGVLGAGIRGVSRGIFRSHKPDPAFRSFVEQCLTEKGYAIVGWQ